MMFKAEQIALAGMHGSQAVEQYIETSKLMGHTWITDTVYAEGIIQGSSGINKATLWFNYTMIPGIELELLSYELGPNWLSGRVSNDRLVPSHYGMHCTEEELPDYIEQFAKHDIMVVQHVNTFKHTSAAVNAAGRQYTYVIFGARHLLGCDLKLIVRRDAADR